METMLLREEGILPTPEVLENVTGEYFPVFKKLTDVITSSDYNFILEWNFYKDGKAWLCKVVFKKKTVFWISVWDDYFKVVFYFTEKHFSGIENLDIDRKVKEDFFRAKAFGKLIPLIFEVRKDEQIDDILKVSVFKSGQNSPRGKD